MPLSIAVSRRCTLVVLITLAFLLIGTSIQSVRYLSKIYQSILGTIALENRPSHGDLSRGGPPSILESDQTSYRFSNGRILLSSSSIVSRWSDAQVSRMTQAQLEVLYENAALDRNADCSTVRRFGRKEDGGWDLCLVGPFTPRQPCLSFSFGVNNIWEFDDEIASEFGCQVFTFDPSMPQGSHFRSDRVRFVKEGLHGAKGNLSSWTFDTYLGFLERFGAQNRVVDILKIDIEMFEWTALETAVRDGSLKNVKQLMLETHIKPTNSVAEFRRFLALFRALHELGFRQWHHNWNTFGRYVSQFNGNETRTCCHELYYINTNFISGTR